MADQCSKEGASNSNASGESSDAVVQLNIKTLDSQIYSFEVNKNMPVCLFKERIAHDVGVPVGQQRLIFRGRVLKDDDPLSEYHVENGHTLHLVVRQPAQAHPSSDSSPSNTNENNGNSAHAGAPQNRAGHISHSVVLGTLNIGDANEGGAPDLSRVIGAVLNSFGIGSQPMANGVNGFQTSVLSNASGQAPQGDGLSNASGGGQNETGNQSQPGQASSGQQFRAATTFPIPSIQGPIPDSLSTLSEFMSRMEQVLSQTDYQSDTSASATVDQPRVELPSNSRGLPTVEALGAVVRHAERLLSGHATTALSHLAGRLEQEPSTTDSDIRTQIQSESARVGLAMQHLGAFLLELGRTILTLRMGQSQAESSVNAGPAVYISSSGPNPIMVQPFPLQSSSLFGGTVSPPNPTPFGPVGMGNAPRHVNIHIHAGTSLSPAMSAVGSMVSNGEGLQGERTGSSGAASVRVLPIRNVIAAAVPSRATAVAVPSGGPSGLGVSVSQPPNSSLIDPVVAEINAQIREVVRNMQGENRVSGTQSALTNSSTVGSNEQSHNITVNGAEDVNDSSSRVLMESENFKLEPECDAKDNNVGAQSLSSSKDTGVYSLEESSSCSNKEATTNPEDESASVSRSSEKHGSPGSSETVPLGLGVGGLERKRRNKQLKSSVKGEESGTSAAPLEQSQNERTRGQQLLQSLFPFSSAADGASTDVLATRQQPSNLESRSSEEQLDVANAMSQVLGSPALDGLLAGFSGQTGVGSPNVLRNMLQQFTQNPQIMNTVQQIAQQADTENMFPGGQGGGFDLSAMIQQMMPVVSHAFSQGPPAASRSNVEPQAVSIEAEKPDDHVLQKNVEQVARAIEGSGSPGDIFHAIVENSVRLPGNENSHRDLVDELCSREGLATEYVEMLRRDIRRRLQGDPGPDKC